MGKVTIQLIAERAGVSRGTVDRVLHNRPNVNPKIRERVQRVVRQTGYRMRQEQATDNPKQIGVLLPGNTWFNADLKRELLRGLEDAKRAVAPYGCGLTIAECETDLPGEFAERIRHMQERGLDTLAICAKNSPVMHKLVCGLTESGMTVITYNSDLPGSGRRCFVGQDPYRSGRVAADLIVKFMEASGRILIVAGNLEIDAHKRRTDGFIDKCVDAGISRDRLLLVESFNEYVLTYEKVAEILAGTSDLQAIYMANESVAACAEALARSGKQGKVMVVGNDLTAVTRRLLREGAVDFIIEQNVYWQGYRPVVLLKDLMLSPGLRVPEYQFTDISVINAENMR